MPNKVTAIFHLAYDWLMAVEAIKRIAPHVDRVLLVSDLDYRTWTGKHFAVPDFEFMLNSLVNHGVEDAHIKLVRRGFFDEFYLEPEMLRIQALPHIVKLPDALRKETLQRNWATLQVAPDHWILQVDGDEWIEQPHIFCAWLRDQNPDVNICGRWVNVWKTLENHVLIVDPTTAPPGYHARLATTRRGELRVSRAPVRGTDIVAPTPVLHWTLGGRGYLGVLEKLRGWGLMKNDKAQMFAQHWDKVDETNYADVSWIVPSAGPNYGNMKLVCWPKTTVSERFDVDFSNYVPDSEKQNHHLQP